MLTAIIEANDFKYIRLWTSFGIANVSANRKTMNIKTGKLSSNETDSFK